MAWITAGAIGFALACGTGEDAESPETGFAPAIREIPYLVSLSPIASRFLLEIGAGDQILAVDARSQRLAGLGDRPVVTLAAALELGPKVVLIPERSAEQADIKPPEAPSGTRIVEFAPHDLEDVLELAQNLGEFIVRREQAHRFSMERSRDLALIGGESFGQTRPRTAAVVNLDPVTLAGGHSFETDLVEIAGGSSVTHGGEETRKVIEDADWVTLSPDLVVVMTHGPMNHAQREAALAVLPGEIETAFFAFSAPGFWIDEPVETARRFRTLIAERARRLDLQR